MPWAKLMFIELRLDFVFMSFYNRMRVASSEILSREVWDCSTCARAFIVNQGGGLDWREECYFFM